MCGFSKLNCFGRAGSCFSFWDASTKVHWATAAEEPPLSQSVPALTPRLHQPRVGCGRQGWLQRGEKRRCWQAVQTSHILKAAGATVTWGIWGQDTCSGSSLCRIRMAPGGTLQRCCYHHQPTLQTPTLPRHTHPAGFQVFRSGVQNNPQACGAVFPDYTPPLASLFLGA